VPRTAFEVVEIVLSRSEYSRPRHTLTRLLSVEMLGVVEAILLLLYHVVVSAPVRETHYKQLSKEFQRLYTQLRDFLTKCIPRMRSYYLRRFGAYEKLRKVDEFGGRAYGFAGASSEKTMTTPFQ
jgi:hypothetical protein